MASIGSLGELVFTVSDEMVRAYKTLSRTSRASYADHKVLNGKPASEFTGEELDEIDMTFDFNATLGVVPMDEVKRLREMKSAAAAYPLLVGADMWGYFTVREVGDTPTHFLRGTPMIVSVSVKLTEYDVPVSEAGREALSREAANRGVTGRGGPKRVPGGKEPLQERVLEPEG